MKLPRQPEIVSMTLWCEHAGDAIDAKDLIVKHLENCFDHVQCWQNDSEVWVIKCYPKAVND